MNGSTAIVRFDVLWNCNRNIFLKQCNHNIWFGEILVIYVDKKEKDNESQFPVDSSSVHCPVSTLEGRGQRLLEAWELDDKRDKGGLLTSRDSPRSLKVPRWTLGQGWPLLRVRAIFVTQWSSSREGPRSFKCRGRVDHQCSGGDLLDQACKVSIWYLYNILFCWSASTGMFSLNSWQAGENYHCRLCLCLYCSYTVSFFYGEISNVTK